MARAAFAAWAFVISWSLRNKRDRSCIFEQFCCAHRCKHIDSFFKGLKSAIGKGDNPVNASRASHSLCGLNGLIAIDSPMASVSKTTTATCIKTTTKTV